MLYNVNYSVSLHVMYHCEYYLQDNQLIEVLELIL